MNLYHDMSLIDYVYVIAKVLVANDQNISKIHKNLGQKLYNLFLNNSHHNSVTTHIPRRVISLYSGHILNTTEKSFLSKELNFEIPPKNTSYAYFMLPFELLYRDINSLEVSKLDKEQVFLFRETL